MAPKKPAEEDMELQVIREDLHETKELVRDIKVLLIGNEALKTHGIIQDFTSAKDSLQTLHDKIEEVTSKVIHIFKWREKYLAGEIERRKLREKKNTNFWLYFFAAIGAVGTLASLIFGLIQLNHHA